MVYVVCGQDDDGFSRPLSVWSSLAAAQACVEEAMAFFYADTEEHEGSRYGDFYWDEPIGAEAGLWRYSDGLDWLTSWVQRLPVLGAADEQ